jgi:hypothetical protein
LPLHKSTNVGIMWSAPSNHKFYAFAAQVKPHLIPDDEEEENQATRRTMVSGREEDNDNDVQQVLQLPIASEGQRELPATPTSEIQREQPVQIEFMDDEIREPVDKPKDVTSKQAALRKCHNRLNHMSFAVGRMNYRRAEGRCQSRIVEKTKNVEREDLWRFVMNNDRISISIDNRLY